MIQPAHREIFEIFKKYFTKYIFHEIFHAKKIHEILLHYVRYTEHTMDFTIIRYEQNLIGYKQICLSKINSDSSVRGSHPEC